MEVPDKVIDKFLQGYADAEQIEDCLVWIGKQTPDGYGRINAAGQVHLAHRVSYEFYVNAIPEGLYVLHSCSRKACVLPKHLRAGTHSENMIDSIRLGTRSSQRLSVEDVTVIDQLLRRNMSANHIADIYDVRDTTIHEIAAGRNWGWLTGRGR